VGTRGPVPKRSIERRRRNADGATDAVTIIGEVRVPPVPQGLHPIARRMYASLRDSGQSSFYEPSDWEAARLAATVTTDMLWMPQQLDRQAKPRKGSDGKVLPRRPRARISAELLAAVWKMWTDLMITEGARRRARLEIVRELSAGDRGVDHLASYRGLGAEEADEGEDA